MRYLILSTLAFALFSCKNDKTATENNFVIDSIHRFSFIADTSISQLPNFNDSNYSVKIIPSGTFHGDEVWDNIEELSWVGLLKNNSGFYLADTKVSKKQVHDGILDDEDDQNTAREVSTNHSDSVLMLISGTRLPNRKVQSIKLKSSNIYPGDTLRFTFLGKSYILFATGKRSHTKSDEEDLEITNYKLYLGKMENQKYQTQLLVAIPRFEDQMVNIKFAGDIDGDGIIDMIIDTSYHYNADAPTLYLSGMAEPGRLLKIVSRHVAVGC